MIIFLTVLFIVLFIGSFIAKYFAHSVPFLGAISTPIIIACVIVGVVWAVFVAIKIINEVKRKK